MGGVVVVGLLFQLVLMWLFYMWGAAIAQGKGRSRALGWWAVFFGLLAILVLYLLPNIASPEVYIPHRSAVRKPGIADELSRLAALRDKGALTAEEFDGRKRALLER
jgi:hypothetical protein